MFNFIFNENFLLHKSTFSHVENPDRMTAILSGIEKDELLKSKLNFIPSGKATDENILLAHSEAHYENVKNKIDAGVTMLDDGDTYACQDSFDVALTAVGSVLKGVDDAIQNKNNSFCAVRPPGHHAESNKAMGFCIFSNVAVGAKYALEKYKLDRIAIFDWDVHHGNGTQEIFYDSNKILFTSIQQHPLWPGTGMANERGIGKGENYTLNFPVPPATDGKIYLSLLREKIIPAFHNFSPDLIFISAGFDAHKDDPISEINLIENDYSEMTKYLRDIAEHKNIQIISVLEGGYNLDALSNSVNSHLRVLAE
ncbi:MAG: histone deacetylase [Chlorobiaceae bacterium]|nr:histone deacetylase [Chlorobiaceae bacterium]MBA4310093.1 histone deacetylase [Chlorobiaceae bacterium]